MHGRIGSPSVQTRVALRHMIVQKCGEEGGGGGGPPSSLHFCYPATGRKPAGFENALGTGEGGG